MTRYSTVMMYLRSCIERTLANSQRRPSLVAADELARLGELAFTGPDADFLQNAFDHLASQAVAVAGIGAAERAADADLFSADLEIDRQLLDAGLPTELLKPLRAYAEASAGVIVTCEAKVAGNRAASVEPSDMQAIIKNEVAAHFRTMHRGVWQAEAQYEQGQMVTSGGSMWSCQRGCIGEKNKPGNSDSWLLCVKRGNDGRDR